MNVDRVRPVIVPIVPCYRPVVGLIIRSSIRVRCGGCFSISCLSLINVSRAFCVGAANNAVRQRRKITVIACRTMRFVFTALISFGHAVADAATGLALATWTSRTARGSLSMAIPIRAAKAIRDAASSGTGTISVALSTSLALAEQDVESFSGLQVNTRRHFAIIVLMARF